MNITLKLFLAGHKFIQVCVKYIKLSNSTDLSCTPNCVCMLTLEFIFTVVFMHTTRNMLEKRMEKRMGLFVAMWFSAHRSKCFIQLPTGLVYCLVEVFCKPLDSKFF